MAGPTKHYVDGLARSLAKATLKRRTFGWLREGVVGAADRQDFSGSKMKLMRSSPGSGIPVSAVLPKVASAFCTEAKRDEIVNFFEPLTDENESMVRSLALVTDTVNECVELRKLWQNKGSSAVNFRTNQSLIFVPFPSLPYHAR